ncbi:MAG TPA: Wzz/FepE/Etk N-terminal domain-containing protein [Anaerolineales bacterium]|nr:Wzz/FepE/Etk N-terminal domain-containing protein [Anaerolineales bacterium]
MEVHLYLTALRKNWWLVALTTLAAMAVALSVSYLSRPVYRASARLILSPDPSLLQQGNDVVNSLNTLDKRSIIATYAEVLNSNRILNETVSRLEISPESLEGFRFSTAVLPETNILEFTVEGPDAQVIVLLANSIGQQAIEYIRSLYTVYTINLLDPATPPVRPISPQPLRDSLLALVLGTAVGGLLAIAKAQLLTPIESFLRKKEIDPESQVLTRGQFENLLAQQVNGGGEGGKFTFGLVQLEGLQSYIDVLPPASLRLILRETTQTLREELRGSDIIGRWHRTTFAILLPETPESAAVSTLGRVQLALSRPVRYGMDGESFQLRPVVSAGEHKTGVTLVELVKQAEKAVARASRDEARFSVF